MKNIWLLISLVHCALVVSSTAFAQPSCATLLKHVEVDWVYDAVVSGTTVFAQVGRAGRVRVFDITDASAPALAKEFLLPDGDTVEQVESIENYFVVASQTKLYVYDSSGPTFSLISEHSLTGPFVNMAANESVLAVAVDSEGMNSGTMVFFLPSNDVGLFQVSTLDITGAIDLAYDGELLYLLGSGSGFAVINVADPHNPSVVENRNLIGSFKHIAASGDVVGLLESNFLHNNGVRFHLLERVSPSRFLLREEGTVSYSASELVMERKQSGSLRAFVTVPYAISNNFVRANTGTVLSLEISDSFGFGINGFYASKGMPLSFNHDGVHAVMADGGAGLQLFDFRFLSLRALGRSSGMGYSSDLATNGNFVFVADGPNGLQVLDMTIGQGPSIVASLGLPKWVYAIALHGQSLFLLNPEGTFYAIDVSDPLSPSLLSSLVVSNDDTFHFEILDNIAYIQDANHGEYRLVQVDISDPENMTEIGAVSLSVPSSAYSADGYLLVQDPGTRLTIYDASTPDQLESLGSVSFPNGIRYVESVGQLLVVLTAAYSGANYELSIVDISDATSPQIITTVSVPGHITSVNAAGPNVILESFDDGLRTLWDINRPTCPFPACIVDPLFDETADLDGTPNDTIIDLASNGVARYRVDYISSNCLADYNHDGLSDIADLLFFLNDWFAFSDCAEYSGDQVPSIDFMDLLSFLDIWFAGCDG